MKCQNHPNATAIEQCARCEIPLCGMCATFTDSEVLCEPCVEIRENEKAVAAQTQKLEQPEPESVAQEYDEELLKAAKKDSVGPILQVLTIASCAVILIARALFFSGPDAQPPPATSPEEVAQLQTLTSLAECMFVFQGVSEALVAGTAIDPLTACPDTPAPLVVRQTDDDIIISHPRPENLGYSEISISRSNPVPRLIE
ncbi:MAG: hypothetical protein MI746_02940 [Pseudomonadales bacterium]|nr:hypothetical protein [Pseudomonadales bacterium]